MCKRLLAEGHQQIVQVVIGTFDGHLSHGLREGDLIDV